MSNEKDRRSDFRIELRSPGVVDLGDHSVPCQTLDLSYHGLAVLTSAPPPARAVRVRFQLGNRDAAWTDVEAMVVHSHPAGQNHVWGLKLQPMDLGTRTRVRGYITTVRRRN